MTSTEFYVSHDGQQLGPYNLQTIVEMIKKSELTMLDYLYDQDKGDWVLLMEHSELSKQLKDHKPLSPPARQHTEMTMTTTAVSDSMNNHTSLGAEDYKTDPIYNDENQVFDNTQPSSPLAKYSSFEWYVLKGENKFGPFAYTDIVKMLQQKVVFEFDFAWYAGLSTWARIADLEAFQPDYINELKNTSLPEVAEVFFRRRHRRVKFGGTVLIHDNQSVWKGTGVEISVGGAGVVMENAMVVPGQTLYLHFKPGDGVPPFNAICEVVSKKYVEGVKDRHTPIRYGLKFTNIHPSVQTKIQEFSNRSEAA